jgi:hypothetical protein
MWKFFLGSIMLGSTDPSIFAVGVIDLDNTSDKTNEPPLYPT